jgi:phospholipase/carboxylesterase
VAELSDSRLVRFEDWTLRVRPAEVEAGQSARLLVLVHGWTGDENSMWVFARNLSKQYWIIAPRAPHATKPRGFSWRPLSSRTRTLPTVEDLRPGIRALAALIDTYADAHRLQALTPTMVGFSQGAALTASYAMLYPARVERLGVLAGFVPRDAADLARTRPLEGKPCFVAHGTLDDMVDIETARWSAALLQEAGAVVTICEDDVGHRLSSGCLRALESFLG